MHRKAVAQHVWRHVDVDAEAAAARARAAEHRLPCRHRHRQSALGQPQRQRLPAVFVQKPEPFAGPDPVEPDAAWRVHGPEPEQLTVMASDDNRSSMRIHDRRSRYRTKAFARSTSI